jgi:sigma-B regulation protein RsbU (phosphoserine phosphatase)
MRYQWKLLLLLLALAMGPLAVMRPFGLNAIGHLGQTLVAQTQVSLLKQTEDRLNLIVEGYAEVLRLTRALALVSLQLQAQEVERLLAAAPGASQPLFIAGHGGNGETPPSLVASDQHAKRGRVGHVRPLPVSYDTPVFKFSPGTDPATLEADSQRLAGMTTFWRTVAKYRGLTLWHFVTLDSGIHMAYPGHDSFPRQLDPRERFAAKRFPGRGMAWLDPYVDPVTRQVVTAVLQPVRGSAGTTVGVTGMVLPISRILERPFMANNLPAGTIPLLCHLEHDDQPLQRRLRIVARPAHSELTHRHWKLPIDAEWLTGDDTARFSVLLQDMAAGRGNMRRLGWQGVDSLWTYGATHPGTILVLITPYEVIHSLTDAAEKEADHHVQRVARSTFLILSAVCGVAVLLAILFSKTVTQPLKRLSEGAQRLASGDFQARVEVRSGDEFGQMARVFNQVGPELQAHYDLQRSLDLAREVQQELLPEDQPQVVGLDVHGKSHYCDQTGGDYFDYLVLGSADAPRLLVIVGDVAGHGIASALLMATARALIRQRLSLEGDLATKLADVNRLLCQDVGDSGQFMTLFVAEVSPADNDLAWVRAGHEPGWCYRPIVDGLETIAGPGLPLGVMETARFEMQRIRFAAGDILIMGTDGIWETLDDQGQMFGKQRLEELVRQHAHLSAQRIVQAVMTALADFRQKAAVVDDATLLVVKRTTTGAS